MSDEKIDEFKGQEKGTYVLKLYVSGITPNSIKAIKNIEAVCRGYREGRFELEVIDIYKRPDLAREAQIIAVPTLIKQLPLPLRRFIGNLSDKEKILVGSAWIWYKRRMIPDIEEVLRLAFLD